MGRLFLVVFFLFFLILFGKVAIAGRFFLLFFVVFFIQIFGDDVQVNGMSLGDFELRFTLWATENLAFFHFVFVDVDFGGTFGAADHVGILRRAVRKVGATRAASTTVERIIYRGWEVNSPGHDCCGVGNGAPSR
jgi:hypothetical protein